MAPGVGGDAPTALSVLWSLLAITSIFVLLRLYTRLRLMHAYGIDDHLYNIAFCIFLAYNIMIQLSSNYGFGRDMDTIDNMDDATQAILYEAIGQTIMVVGTQVSKMSLAFFLFRLVSLRRDQIAIMAPAFILGLAITASLFVFWFSCTPTSYLWDRRTPGGHCTVDPGPIAVFAGSWSVFVDFWYAGFPWYMMWKLQMPKKDKIIIASSMSLGVLAGACGIERAIQLKYLGSANYLKDTVGIIIWHAAELSTTMICIGIPVCMPLYKKLIVSFNSRYGRSSSPSGYEKHLENGDKGVFSMHTIGGTTYPGHAQLGEDENGTGVKFGENEIVIRGSSIDQRATSDNQSDEAILMDKSDEAAGSKLKSGQATEGIRVKKMVTIQRSSRA